MNNHTISAMKKQSENEGLSSQAIPRPCAVLMILASVEAGAGSKECVEDAKKILCLRSSPLVR